MYFFIFFSANGGFTALVDIGLIMKHYTRAANKLGYGMGGVGGGERPALNAATPYLTFRDFQKLVRKIAQKVGCPLKMEIPGGVEFVAPGGGEKLFSSLLYTPPAPRTP